MKSGARMSRACSMHREKKNAYRVLAEKPEGRRGHRQQDNIKIIHKEI
jgi:hypothetical protein